MNLPKHLSLHRATSKATAFKYRHPLHNGGKPETISLPAKDDRDFSKRLDALIIQIDTLNAEYAGLARFKKDEKEIITTRKTNFVKKTFAEVADMALMHMKEKNQWGHKSAKGHSHYAKLAKDYFGAQQISVLTIAECSVYLEKIQSEKSSGVARICRHQLTNIFKFAIQRGYYLGENPVRETDFIAAPKASKRPLTLEQYDAIYQAAPEWMQIAMTISMQTSQRPYDIRNLKWTDIENNILTIIPHKIEAMQNREKAGNRIKFAFDLSKDPILAAAIKRAEILQKKLSLMRMSFRNCPFIIARAPDKVRAVCKTLEHPCQITETVSSHCFKEVRDQVHASSKVFWHNGIEPTQEQLPGWYGIRKLSLQMIAASHGLAAAQNRGGHTDASTTIDFYLGTMDHKVIDATLPEVRK